jgi:hypothetical protein
LTTIKHSRQKTATNSTADSHALSARGLLDHVNASDLTIDSAHDREAFTATKSSSVSGSTVGTGAMRGAARTARSAYGAQR